MKYPSPNVSRLTDMSHIVKSAKKSMKKSIDLVKQSEVNVERLRQLNYSGISSKKIIGSLANVGSDLIKNLSINKVSTFIGGNKSAKDSMIQSELMKAVSTLFSRAVGPLEELPMHQLQDSVRRKIILTNTQLEIEHKMIAKLMQARNNKYKMIQDVGGTSPITNLFEKRKLFDPVKKLDIGLSRNEKNNSGNTYDEKSMYSRSIAAKSFGYKSEDVFPFSIKNLASGKIEGFPPFIKTLNESISPTWNNVSLYNRSEDGYLYQSTSRSFNLDFVLFASTNEETVSIDLNENMRNNIGYPLYPQSNKKQIDVIDFLTKQDLWRKINFLHQCTRPSYVDNLYKFSPYCLLTIGDLFQEILMVIDSLNLGYDPIIWDLNEEITEKKIGIKPMMVNVTMSGKFMHRFPPHSNYTFYLDRE